MPSDHVPHPESETRTPFYMRLPDELMARVKLHQEAMQRRAAKGVRVTQTGAVENLLELALERVAAERAA